MHMQSIMSETITISLPASTLICTLIHSSLRFIIEPVTSINNLDTIYVSQRLMTSSFPQELVFLFEDVQGLFGYLLKISKTPTAFEKVVFVEGVLWIKLLVEDRLREFPIKMNHIPIEASQNGFLITALQVSRGPPSQAETSVIPSRRHTVKYIDKAELLQSLESRINQGKATDLLLEKAQRKNRELREIKGMQPYKKPLTHSRYDTLKSKTQAVIEGSRSMQQKTHLSMEKRGESKISRISKIGSKIVDRKVMKSHQIDLSNKEVRINQIRELVSYDWANVTQLNLGYNHIGDEGVRLVTSIGWPSLQMLYLCFNSITKIDWNPVNIKYTRTLSLSGNKIKEIPSDIAELQELEQLFIYANKLETLPEELLSLSSLKNFSVYNNKLDPFKSRRLLSKLRANKVHIWD